MKRLIGMTLATALTFAAGAAAAQDVALTYDDLPAHRPYPDGETAVGVTARLLAAFDEAGATSVMGFVNGKLVADEPSLNRVLAMWRAAGHPLGNHGWSHANLNDIGAAGFAEEVAKNEPTLQALAGDSDWHWFRYPFLSEGTDPAVRAAARHVLAERGYHVASVTLDFGDWAWNAVYARCSQKGDAAAIAQLEQDYLAAADQALTSSTALSQALYGRDIPLVMLMHAGAFDARMAPRFLALYRTRGVRFVPLDQAMADPFYDTDREAEATPAPLTLEAAATAAGKPLPTRIDYIARIDGLCR